MRNVTDGCTIRPYARVATGSNGLTYHEDGRWVFLASGVGIGNLLFDDGCTYELVVHPDGVGAVWSGQTN